MSLINDYNNLVREVLNDFTVDEIADKSGINRHTVSRWKHGYDLSEEKLNNLRVNFDVYPKFILVNKKEDADSVIKKLNETVRQDLIFSNLTQNNISNLTGLTQPRVSNFINGIDLPLNQLDKIAVVLGRKLNFVISLVI
jgi:transcriptional regulator with XRE-family HTH domain